MEKKNLALTFGATDNYTFALCNVLLGIKKYSHKFWNDIIVFHTDITPENQRVINTILPCTFVEVDDRKWLERLEKNLGAESVKMYSLATMFRYYCFDYLKQYRKVVWLDCDLLIQNDISGIEKYGDKTGYAACYADNMAPVEMCYKRMIPGYNMFIPLINAGTLVLTDQLPNYENLCHWCKEKTIQYAKDLDMPDQGILNLMLQEFQIEVEPIDVTKYQCHPQAPKATFRDSVSIVHAYGTRKFWSDSIYQNMFPEWVEFNDEYTRIAEQVQNCKLENKWRMPLVSVIMSPYNRDDFLMEAVGSILKQTYKNFEFIIVVEFSNKQQTIVRRLETIKDPRIKIVANKTKLGFSKSLNVALDMAKGEYVARMDDDDISYPDRFQKQVDFLQKNPEIGILGTHAETFMQRHDIWNRYPIDPEYAAIELLRGTVLCHPTVMMRRCVLEKYHLRYNPDAFTEDFDFWARAVQYTKISNIPEILFGYRASGMNITVNQEINVHKSHLNVMRYQFREYLNMEPSEDELALFSNRIDIRAMVYTKNRNAADEVFLEFTKKIAEANKKTKFYNQEKLEKHLNLNDGTVKAKKQKNAPRIQGEGWKTRFLKLIKRVFKPLADQLVWTFSRRTYDLINARADSMNLLLDRQQSLLEENADAQKKALNSMDERITQLEEMVATLVKANV